MDIVRYTKDKAQEWDALIEGSRNGTFLFLRGYMDYHADRFADHSLMYYSDKGRLLAVMPANERDSKLFSHQGLTYGGLILHPDTRTTLVMEIFDMTIEYLRERGFHEWYYKQIPTAYHRMPCQEDEYALWRHGAELHSCLISTTIPLNGYTSYPEPERRRRRGFNKATHDGYYVMESDDIQDFWPIMEANLSSRYAVKPVHTVEEMRMLKDQFPDRIICFLVKKDDKAEGGCIAYLANDACVHIQYGHATPKGKQDGVLDLLYITLIKKFKEEGYCNLDFGNSNEDGGRYLNENLIAQKEGFGGRGMAYKIYKITI